MWAFRDGVPGRATATRLLGLWLLGLLGLLPMPSPLPWNCKPASPCSCNGACSERERYVGAPAGPWIRPTAALAVGDKRSHLYLSRLGAKTGQEVSEIELVVWGTSGFLC